MRRASFHWRFFAVAMLLIQPVIAMAERRVHLNFQETTIQTNAVFWVNGFAISVGSRITRLAAFIGDRQAWEMMPTEAAPNFNFALSNSVAGNFPLVVRAWDAHGNEISSPQVPLHFAGRIASRIAWPAEGAELHIGHKYSIRVEAEVDFGTVRHIGVGWEGPRYSGGGGDSMEPYEVLFEPSYPGVYQLVSSAAVEWMNAPTLSTPITVNVLPEGLPLITRQPRGRDLRTGETLELSVESFSRGEQRFQWRLNGRPIPGATAATYTIADAQKSDDGFYCVTIDNFAGRVVSEMVDIAVSGGGGLVRFANRIESIDARIESRGQTQTQPPYISARLLAGPVRNRMRMGEFLRAPDGYFDGGEVALHNIEPGERMFVQVFAKDEIPMMLMVGLYGYSKPLELTAGGAGTEATLLEGMETFTLSRDAIFVSHVTNNVPNGARAGETVRLGATLYAQPEEPNVRYQWNKNGAALAGETNAVLEIRNVRREDAGYYSVIVEGGTRLREVGHALGVEARGHLELSPAGELWLLGAPGEEHRIEVTADFVMWHHWRTVTPAAGGVWTSEPVIPPEGKRFYRARGSGAE